MKLDVKAFAITSGLLWGLGLFLLTLWVVLLDGPSDRMTFIGQVYRGYSLTIGGSVVGLVWGLVDGAIGGAVFAWLYNSLAGRSKKA
jgi:hypothetical protein